jgi:hypothetical protein
MYKPSTYLVVTYFPPIYLCTRPISYRIGYQGETKYVLTQLSFIHNWVITGIQWMVRWFPVFTCGRIFHQSETNQVHSFFSLLKLMWIQNVWFFFGLMPRYKLPKLIDDDGRAWSWWMGKLDEEETSWWPILSMAYSLLIHAQILKLSLKSGD